MVKHMSRPIQQVHARVTLATMKDPIYQALPVPSRVGSDYQLTVKSMANWSIFYLDYQIMVLFHNITTILM
jgi:hypothetical protein